MGMRVIYVIKLLSPRSELKAHLQTQTHCKPVSLIERGEGLAPGTWLGLMGPWPVSVLAQTANLGLRASLWKVS